MKTLLLTASMMLLASASFAGQPSTIRKCSAADIQSKKCAVEATTYDQYLKLRPGLSQCGVVIGEHTVTVMDLNGKIVGYACEWHSASGM